MADGIFPSLVSRTRDVNSTSNVIYTQLADGAGNVVNITSNALAVTASDLDIRPIQAGEGVTEDNILIFANTVKDGTGTNYVPLVDSDGNLQVDVLTMPTVTVTGSVTIQEPLSVDDNNSSLTVDFTEEYADDSAFTPATSKVVGIGLMADETAPDSVDEGDIGIPRMTLDRKQLMVIVDKTTDANRLVVNSDGSLNVNVTSSAITGEVHNYDTSVNVAVDTGDNHDYTVANSVFLLKSVIVSASGNIKFEIQTGPLASLATRAVGFLNGRQGDTKQVFFDPPIEVPVTSTGTVRVIRTNRQGATMDVYSTIIGIDV